MQIPWLRKIVRKIPGASGYLEPRREMLQVLPVLSVNNPDTVCLQVNGMQA